MKRNTSLFAVLVLAAIVAVVPAANAQVNVHYIGGGSSAMYQGIGVAAYNDLALGVKNSAACTASGVTCTAGHWSLGTAAANVRVHDGASGAPDEAGNSWIAWTTCTAVAPATCPRTVGANNSMDVWMYLQLDSAVGVREFLRRDASLPTPLPSLIVLNAGGVGPLPAGANKISSALFTDASVDVVPPNDVYTALQNAALTAGMTDIRAEDALNATLRVLGTCPAAGCNTSLISAATANPCPSGDTGVPAAAPPCTDFPYFQSYSLGYGSEAWATAPNAPYPDGKQFGAGIQSTVAGGAVATPVGFSLPGFADPFSGNVVPATIKHFSVGESPIIVIVNRQNSSGGMGGLIGDIPACAANGLGTDARVCVDDPANGGPAYNGGSGLGYTSDGSYLIRNVWDQHPYPPSTNGVTDRFPDVTYTPLKAGDGFCAGTGLGTGTCHESRHPLGSLFAGFVVETASPSFGWPQDSALVGNRVFFPTNGSASAACPAGGCPVVPSCVPLTVFEREPTSGTYNTFEFSSIRRAGGTQGNFNYDGSAGNMRWQYTAYLSQEDEADGTPANAGGPTVGGGTNNPMSVQGEPAFQDCGTEGFKKRTTGTGELVTQVHNTVDSIGYAFFSFGNVSSIKQSASYGYLMINGVDPLFANYSNSPDAAAQVEPGQPATAANPRSWGELPGCTGSGCESQLIWLTTVAADATATCPVGTICTYPHLRDGTYPAWSELRMLCDTAVATCETDPLGAVGLIQNLQSDIHNHNLGGVPDLLPFSDSSGQNTEPCPTCSFNPPFGDVHFLRDHSAKIVAPSAIPGDVPNGGIVAPNNYQNFIMADDEEDEHHFGWPYLGTLSPQTIHKTINAETQAQLMTICGGGRGTNAPPDAECGGDVGGFVIPVPAAGTCVGGTNPGAACYQTTNYCLGGGTCNFAGGASNGQQQ